MSKAEKDILRDILRDVKAGYRYGKDYTWNYYENKPYRYPYFGSSAIKATLRDLEWLITVIFKTTPSGFLRDYIRNDQSAIA